MRYFGTKTFPVCFVLFAVLLGQVDICTAESALPKGLMLNLDFQNIKDGLIPNKALFPLYVPLSGLGIEPVNSRNVLAVQHGQGLDIPHSSLLDPDGSEWITTVRVFTLTDGIVMSQGNDETGYVIYIKDGAVQIAIRTGPTTIILKERPENGITSCRNKWVTIDLRIKPEVAILSLNRNRVALVSLQAPLIGKNHLIRIGEHRALPAPLQRNTTATPTGFTGGISSLKVLRQ